MATGRAGALRSGLDDSDPRRASPRGSTVTKQRFAETLGVLAPAPRERGVGFPTRPLTATQRDVARAPFPT